MSQKSLVAQGVYTKFGICDYAEAPFSTPNGMSVGSGGSPARRGAMLMVCVF